MRQITAYTTRDGCVFTDRRSAKSHAGEIYGALLTKLATAAIKLDKYTQMLAFIEEHVDDFALLKELLADMKVENENEATDTD